MKQTMNQQSEQNSPHEPIEPIITHPVTELVSDSYEDNLDDLDGAVSRS